jgi:hypothetical protein
MNKVYNNEKTISIHVTTLVPISNKSSTTVTLQLRVLDPHKSLETDYYTHTHKPKLVLSAHTQTSHT